MSLKRQIFSLVALIKGLMHDKFVLAIWQQ